MADDRRLVTVEYLEEYASGIQPIDENTEFIFDGGDVDGGVSVDIVVDTVLSKTSNNPIANKPVAVKFGEILGAIEQAKKDILLSAYPVGSVYISTVSTSPSALFGGTWERIKDTFLLAAGTTYTAGTTGGEATHTLTIDEMPRHRIDLNAVNAGLDEAGSGYHPAWVVDKKYTAQALSANIGGDQPHNNMPPYLAVYVWKRTA